MKKILILTAGMFISASAWAATDVSSMALEPCINGEVSATGAYETQYLEDKSMKSVRPEQLIQM